MRRRMVWSERVRAHLRGGRKAFSLIGSDPDREGERERWSVRSLEANAIRVAINNAATAANDLTADRRNY